jgi:hypothetical protein
MYQAYPLRYPQSFKSSCHIIVIAIPSASLRMAEKQSIRIFLSFICYTISLLVQRNSGKPACAGREMTPREKFPLFLASDNAADSPRCKRVSARVSLGKKQNGNFSKRDIAYTYSKLGFGHEEQSLAFFRR